MQTYQAFLPTYLTAGNLAGSCVCLPNGRQSGKDPVLTGLTWM
ncbi:MAG TPA: hypothetical protein VF691_20010 [Cytophagaceae bacterium]